MKLSRIMFVIPLGLLILSNLCCQRGDQDDIQLLRKNYIKNPSFESGTDGVEHWKSMNFPSSPEADFIWKTDPARNGKIAGLEYTRSGAGGWMQEINLDPDGRYQLRGWLKTRNIEGKGMGAALLIPQFRWMAFPSLKKSDDWTYVEADLFNAGFTRLDLVCSLGVYGGNTGYAWFDDIELIQYQAAETDPKKTREIQWNNFQLRYNLNRGYITSLKPGRGFPDSPEFLAGYATLPYLNVNRDHYLGDIALDIRVGSEWETITTADQDIMHDISMTNGTLNVKHYSESGVRPTIQSTWHHLPDSVMWNIVLENKTDSTMTIGAVDIPFPWNDNYCIFDPHDKASQKLLYTRRVAEHKHIAGESSYILACPMDGTSPMLAVMPGDRMTQFEFTYHEIDTIRNQRRNADRWIHGAWPGLTRICLASSSIIQKNDWKPWLNEHTDLTLNPGDSRTFSIRFQWIDKRSQLEDRMGESGLLGIRAIPGPAVVKNEPFLAVVNGAVSPLFVDGATEWEEIPVPKDFKGAAFKAVLAQEGFQTVQVRDSADHAGKLFMAVLAPVSEIMDRRSQFILKNQVYNQPNHPLNQAILCYNNREKNVFINMNDMWGSGGYEGGITDAQFMALKNLDLPDKDEIQFLETYIDKWLLGGIQNPLNYGVCWMVSRKDRIERGYNYIHVLNLYDAMARASEVWPDLFQHPASHYLDLWIKTFNAFQQKQVRFRDLGLMGRGNISFMPELLTRFQLSEEAQMVKNEMQTWAKYWSEDPPYPYGSELFFDNTGYETVFFYCHAMGYTDLAQQTINVTKAGRGRAPCWFWNDSDQRWWDAVRTHPQYATFTDFGENCHHYMTGLNGYMLLEAFDLGYGRNEPGPIGFSGILNNWARVQSDGFAGMCYCPDPSSDNYGLNQFTGDVGLGLWGSLKAARCYLIKDPVLSYISYGGTVTHIKRDSEDKLESVTLTPYQGFDHRLRLTPWDLAIDSFGPSIEWIQWIPHETKLILLLNNRLGFECSGRLTLKGLPAGEYVATWKSAETDTVLESTPTKEIDKSISVIRSLRPHKSIILEIAPS